jgi:hypothetical protein
MTLTWSIQTVMVLQLEQVVLMMHKQKDDEYQKENDAKR